MQTPYLLIKGLKNRELPQYLQIEDRERCEFKCGPFVLAMFPPTDKVAMESVLERVHVTNNKLYYEDGFMLRYPESYEPCARNKLQLFSEASNQLDGFYSRIVIQGDRATIDGSGMYLQTLFSYHGNGLVVFSNYFDALVSLLRGEGIEPRINEDFFASHFINQSLAFYAFAGTPYTGIRTHDSLETITIENTVDVQLSNKFDIGNFSSLERSERIDLLHARLSHLLREYTNYIDVPALGHNLTGGRDSRTSLALFLQNAPDRLEISTAGSKYTHDRVISNHVARRYSLNTTNDDDPVATRSYDYTKSMTKSDDIEWFIAMFRKIVVKTGFDSQKFTASGYLGNVISASPSVSNQITVDNRFSLSDDVFDRLRSLYDKKLTAIGGVYGENAYSIFNTMYNTTNKVSSLCRRLKKHTFCIFENDFFQGCYFLESDAAKKANALHYELIKRSSPELLTSVPFESNKSFETMPDTFELQTFTEADRPRAYKHFLEENLDGVRQFIVTHRAELAFLSDGFHERLAKIDSRNLAIQDANKIYAALGTLAFKGIDYTDFDARKNVLAEHHYDMDFFERLYMENQIYASGLAAMTYDSVIRFKSYIRLPAPLEFYVDIRSVSSGAVIKSIIEDHEDGHLVSCSLPETGKYRINISSYDRGNRIKKHLFKTIVVAKLTSLPNTTNQVAA